MGCDANTMLGHGFDSVWDALTVLAARAGPDISLHVAPHAA